MQSAFESRLGQVIGPDGLLALAQGGGRQGSGSAAGDTRLHRHLLCPAEKQSGVRAHPRLSARPLCCPGTEEDEQSWGQIGQPDCVPLFSLREEPGASRRHRHPQFRRQEGTPTRAKNIIDRGILTTFLHNLETARTAGVEPTGNGFKRLYRGPPATGFTNLCILGGAATWEELIATMHTDCDHHGLRRHFRWC